MPVWREDQGPPVQIEEIRSSRVVGRQLHEDLVVRRGPNLSGPAIDRGIGASRPSDGARNSHRHNGIGMLVGVGCLSGGIGSDQCQTERACDRERAVRTLHDAPSRSGSANSWTSDEYSIRAGRMVRPRAARLVGRESIIGVAVQGLAYRVRRSSALSA